MSGKPKSVQHSRELPHLGILQKFRIIVSAAQKYSQRVEKQLGVTGAQLWIMKEIDVSPGLRVGEVAKKTRDSPDDGQQSSGCA